MLPKVSVNHTMDLAPGWGRLHASGELLGIGRNDDDAHTYNGVPIVAGNEGGKQHLMLEAAWEDQFILPGGVTATPYLGGRLDATSYDRTTGPIGARLPDDARCDAAAQRHADRRDGCPLATGRQERFRHASARAGGAAGLSRVVDYGGRHHQRRRSELRLRRRPTCSPTTISPGSTGRIRVCSRTSAAITWPISPMAAGSTWWPASPSICWATKGSASAIRRRSAPAPVLAAPASYLVASARGGFSNGLSGGGQDPGRSGGAARDPCRPRRQITSNAYRFSTGGSYVYIAKDPALGTVTDQHEVVGQRQPCRSPTIGPSMAT